MHLPSHLYETASSSLAPFLYLSLTLLIPFFKSTFVGLTAFLSDICAILCY